MTVFCRADSVERGRHLKACQYIPKGQLIFSERPLLALQSLGENIACAWVCHSCKAFVGGPEVALERRFVDDPTPLIEQYRSTQAQLSSVNVSDSSEEAEHPYRIVPCRNNCGHVFCSRECEVDAWIRHHSFLCTGCLEEDHPLVRFKQLAVESNEILLLIAEWWVTQHTRLKSASSYQARHGNNIASPHAEADPYTDFCMEPWWDVATADIRNQPDQKDPTAWHELDVSLRRLCRDAAELFNQAFQNDDTIPPVTDLDIARRIGACEQNAIGIRQRHPLCVSIFDDDIQQRKHNLIIKCLAESGLLDKEGEETGEIESSRAEEPHNGNDSHLRCNNSDVVENDHQSDASCRSYDDSEEECEYSVDDISSLLADLSADKTGSKHEYSCPTALDLSNQGDELDYVFPPLDGTAMYALACKMNHSCDPNVTVLYKRVGWGRNHPLTAFCMALKDIKEGEELTISYIDSEQSFSLRQAALNHYGFKCCCHLCAKEQFQFDLIKNEEFAI